MCEVSDPGRDTENLVGRNGSIGNGLPSILCSDSFHCRIRIPYGHFVNNCFDIVLTYNSNPDRQDILVPRTLLK